MKNFEKYSYLLSKNKDFQKLFFAKFITYMGDWFLTVPLLSIIYEITNSPLITSIVLVAAYEYFSMIANNGVGGFLVEGLVLSLILLAGYFFSPKLLPLIFL